MRTLLGPSRIGALVFAGAALFLSAAPSFSQTANAPVAASEIVLALDPAQSRVHWSVDSTLHTVHGTFAVKSGTVHFDPETGMAGGEIIVDAPSGESGNGARDRRMHKEILETSRYPEVIFRPTRVEGKVLQHGASDADVAQLVMDIELTALVHAELTANGWRGTAKFEVPYVTWGIKDPGNFLLKVQPRVNVELEMSGELRKTK